MLAGLSEEERFKLNLDRYNVSNLQYLSQGDIHQDIEEDTARFQAWKTCLGVLGIPFLDVVRVLAAVLLLGNTTFVDSEVSLKQNFLIPSTKLPHLSFRTKKCA